MSADKIFPAGKGRTQETDMQKLADKIRAVKASSSSWVGEVQDRIAAVGQRIVNDRAQVKTASAPERKTPFLNNQMKVVVRADQGAASTGPRDIRQIAAQDRDRQINNIVARARELLQEKIAGASLTGADVYFTKADISRWDDATGTPQTGRIAFQIPFSTPQGGPRTIYANVDIVLGDPMPPRYFSDSLNHHYAFDKSGIGELLQGSTFDVVQTPHVVPEQKFVNPEFHSPSGVPGQVAAVDGPRIIRAALDMTRQAGAVKPPRHVAEGFVRSISQEAMEIAAPLSPSQVQEIKTKPMAQPPRQPAHALSNYPTGAESNTGYPEGDQAPGKSTMASVVVAASGMSQVVDDLKLMDMRMISFRDLIQLLKQHGSMASVDFDSAASTLAKDGIVLYQTAGGADASLGRRVVHAHAQRLTLAAPVAVPPVESELPTRTEQEPEAKPQGQAAPQPVPAEQPPAPEGEARITPPEGMDTVEFKEWRRLMDEWRNEKATMDEREENNVKNGLAPETGIDYTNLQLIMDKIRSVQSSVQGRAAQELQGTPSELAQAPKTKPGPGAGGATVAPSDMAGAPAEQTLIPQKGQGLAADRRRTKTAVAFDTPAAIDDDELRLWVLNDEGLYNWWMSEGGTEDTSPDDDGFIEKHRAELQQAVYEVLNPKGHEHDQPDPGHKHWIGASTKTALDQALDMKEQALTVLDGAETVAANTANIDAATGGGTALPKTADMAARPPLGGSDFDLTGMIMAFEDGSLDDEGIIKLFQHLVDTGLAWKLQGSYGRTAQSLIERGLITPPAKTAAYDLDDDAKAQMTTMGMDPTNQEQVKQFMGTYKKMASHSQKFPEVCKNCKYLMVPVGYSALKEFKHTRLPICGAAKADCVGFRFAYFRECAAYEPIAKDVEQAIDVNAPASEQKDADGKKVIKPICERRAAGESGVCPKCGSPTRTEEGSMGVGFEACRTPGCDWSSVGGLGRMTPPPERRAGKAQDWISRKIEFLMKEEGLTQDQAQGKAYGMARQEFPGQVPEKTAAALPSVDPKSVKDKDSQTGHALDIREWCKSHGHYAPVGEVHPVHDWCTLWNTAVENLVMLPSGAVVPRSLSGMSSEPQGEGGARQFARDPNQA